MSLSSEIFMRYLTITVFIIPSFFANIVKYSCYISPRYCIIMLENYTKTHFILKFSYKKLKPKLGDLIFKSDCVIIFDERRSLH